MKRALFSSLFLLFTILLFSQDRTANGSIIDKDSKAVIVGAKISVVDTTYVTYSDEGGRFSIRVPRKHRSLYVSKEDYSPTFVDLKPGFQHRPLRVYLKSTQDSQIRINNDSIFASYKNALTLSLIELFAVAISPRYERFLALKHSIGVHSSIYVYGRNPVALGSEHDYYPSYYGFKLAPGYRFYPLRKDKRGLFIEAKIPFGYISFTNLDYHTQNLPQEVNLKYSFWSVGYSAAVGFMLGFKNHAVLNLSLGYQYFPIDVPKSVKITVSNGSILSLPTDTYWWYQGGPGTKFELKFLIGGIF